MWWHCEHQDQDIRYLHKPFYYFRITIPCRAFFCLRRPEGIIHRDIKPSNVLLDSHWTAKLGDVGLGKILSGEESTSMLWISHSRSSRLAGTFSYMDPEYMACGQVSFSSDVYSLGVLLLKTIIGESTQRTATFREIVEDAVEDKSNSFVDIKAGPWPSRHALAFAQLALDCAEPRRRRRPDLEKDVLPALEKLYAECSSSLAAHEHNADRNLCVVCMDAPATHVLIPCGHKCVCESDAHGFVAHEKACPLCRAQTTDVIRVY